MNPDLIQFRALIEAYEMLDRQREDADKSIQPLIPEASEIVSHTRDIFERGKARMLAIFGSWPGQFQGIANKEYEGIELNSQTLRRMWGRIHAEHPEMTVSDIDRLVLPDAYKLLAPATGQRDRCADAPRKRSGRTSAIPEPTQRAIITERESGVTDRYRIAENVSAKLKTKINRGHVNQVLNALSKRATRSKR